MLVKKRKGEFSEDECDIVFEKSRSSIVHCCSSRHRPDNHPLLPGRLTIARAIGGICFLDEVWEVELGKFSEKKKKNFFSEKKKKKKNVGIRTHAHSPLMGQCNYH